MNDVIVFYFDSLIFYFILSEQAKKNFFFSSLTMRWSIWHLSQGCLISQERDKIRYWKEPIDGCFQYGLLFPGTITWGSCLMGLQNYQYQEKPWPGIGNRWGYTGTPTSLFLFLNKKYQKEHIMDKYICCCVDMIIIHGVTWLLTLGLSGILSSLLTLAARIQTHNLPHIADTLPQTGPRARNGNWQQNQAICHQRRRNLSYFQVDRTFCSNKIMEGKSMLSPHFASQHSVWLTSFPPPPCLPPTPVSLTPLPPGPPSPAPSASPRSGTAEINTIKLDNSAGFK